MVKTMLRHARASLVVLAFGLALSLAPVEAQSKLPAGLPNHFGVGLTANPTEAGIYGWMPQSGVPWDYAYQYLAGGVNTGHGWETWNPNGQFALWYAQGA